MTQPKPWTNQPTNSETQQALPTFLRSYVSNCMEQNPSWEANSHPASQEIPCLLWNTKVHYGVHNSPTLVGILSQMHPVHYFPSYFSKIHSNIIFLSAPTSSERSRPPRSSDWNWLKLCLCCINGIPHVRYSLIVGKQVLVMKCPVPCLVNPSTPTFHASLSCHHFWWMTSVMMRSNPHIYGGVSKSFRTGRLERELQVVALCH
jgi:hypothetical protein